MFSTLDERVYVLYVCVGMAMKAFDPLRTNHRCFRSISISISMSAVSVGLFLRCLFVSVVCKNLYRPSNGTNAY